MNEKVAEGVVCHIVCLAHGSVIGHADGAMPWHISADLKRFKKITMHAPVIMGRKTWESLPGALPGRLNIVVTRSDDYSTENHDKDSDLVRVCSSIDSALGEARAWVRAPGALKEREEVREIFIIGGGEIYRATAHLVDRVYLTRLHRDYPGEVSYPSDVTASLIKVHTWDFEHEDRSAIEEAKREKTSPVMVQGAFEVWQKASLPPPQKFLLGA